MTAVSEQNKCIEDVENEKKKRLHRNMLIRSIHIIRCIRTPLNN